MCGKTTRCCGCHRIVDAVKPVHASSIVGKDTGNGKSQIDTPNPFCHGGKTRMHLGAQICLETLDKIIAADGHPESIPQEELEGKFKRLYEAPKLFKDICEIDWNRPCKRIYDFIRGLSPYPGAWTSLMGPNGKTVDLKIFKTTKTEKSVGMKPGIIVLYKGVLYITTADYLLQIDELQLAGRERMKARDFLNGNKNIESYIIK